MTTENRARCLECDWIGPWTDVLKAQNPFDAHANIHGCPSCKEAMTMGEVCDEPNCTNFSSCGFPTKHGYRRTCGKHYKPETA